MTIKEFFKGLFLCMFIAILLMVFIALLQPIIFSQSHSLIQVDYKDIGHRQQIDRTLRSNAEVLDRQTQADTLVFGGGNTADTVYLDNKYKDMAYVIFLLYRKEIGTQYSDIPYAYPLSDSSFIISSINTDDSSVVQWMTIHK